MQLPGLELPSFELRVAPPARTEKRPREQALGNEEATMAQAYLRTLYERVRERVIANVVEQLRDRRVAESEIEQTKLLLEHRWQQRLQEFDTVIDEAEVRTARRNAMVKKRMARAGAVPAGEPARERPTEVSAVSSGQTTAEPSKPSNYDASLPPVTTIEELAQLDLDSDDDFDAADGEDDDFAAVELRCRNTLACAVHEVDVDNATGRTRLCLQNCLASINGKEYFFATLEAELPQYGRH
ncbi:MAG: hypothetical protein MHM6MM_008697 [Cercozoa sp. M6MM]